MLDAKSVSWTRYYFVLKGMSFSYHSSIKAHQGQAIGGMNLVSSSSIQLLANDEYDRANCFRVKGTDEDTGKATEMVCAADNQDEVDSWASAILSAG